MKSFLGAFSKTLYYLFRKALLDLINISCITIVQQLTFYLHWFFQLIGFCSVKIAKQHLIKYACNILELAITY